MSKLKKIVVIYVRKSRLKDDDTMEISRQIELLVEFCNDNDMEYVIFQEEGSSENWDRPEFQKMLKEIETKQIYDGILVSDQDRISRDSTDMGLFKRFCKKNSILLYTLTKTYNYLNDEDDFISGIQAEMDSHFMRITKRKMLRGRIKALSSGIYFGVAPYGYSKTDSKPKKLIINEEESEVVKTIFDLYVKKKMNQREIVDRLNLLGYTTRNGNVFTVRATSFILRNKAYTGTLYYELAGREPIVVNDAHPVIIDDETFNKAQLLLNERRIVPQDSRKGTYILSKLLRCPVCNTNLSFSYSYKSSTRREKGKELYILNCHASSGSKKKQEIQKLPKEHRCKSFGTKASIVEQEVFNALHNHLDDIESEIDALISKGDSMFDTISSKIEIINTRLNDLKSERKRVQDGYRKGFYDDKEVEEIFEEININKLKLETEKSELEKMDLSSEVEKKNATKEKILSLLSEEVEDVETINKLLREIIEFVHYYKDKPDTRTQQYPPIIHIKFKQ